MDNLSDLLSRYLREALSAATLLSLAALLFAAAAARFAATRAARWIALSGRSASAGRTIAREAMLLAVPYTAALLVLLAARGLAGLAHLDARLLDKFLGLYGALITIRAVAFLLRVSLGPHSRLRTWELRAALFVWFFVAMHLLGWFEAVAAFLDSIAVTPSIKGEAALTLWSIIRSLFTVIAFVIISAWIGRVFERRVAEVHALAPGTRLAVAKFSYAFLISLGALLGLSASGLSLGALGVFGGALGLGLGFGLQAIAANFVSGFVLLMDKSIKPGDVISFTGNIGTSTEGFGWVQELRGRYVVVRDRDGVETLVPNQNLITNQVINWSYSDKRVRLKLPVRISYEDDPEQAMEVLLRAAECSPRILREPAPVARMMSFHDYGIDLELRFWIADPEAGVNNVRSDVNRSIWRLFKKHGITIPRAQLDVRMYDADGRIVGSGSLPIARRDPAPASASVPGGLHVPAAGPTTTTPPTGTPPPTFGS
jgi:small-conductance mechanosensitive channel